MSDEQIRVRFAPSPTGFLHIGGARTALFNYLYARHNNGVMVLRIEDTDSERSTDEYIEAIIDGMKWLGLDWDEGPFRQTERSSIYEEYAKKLLDRGEAYFCYCSAEELEAKRQKAQSEKRPYKYDGKCRNIQNGGEPILDSGRHPVIRFKMPIDGQTVIEDLIKKKVIFENKVLDDFIIVRSDGMPTYNFVVVVDDIDMGITHIIRGDDHLNNTPKQVRLYMAFGKTPPVFAHLSMILGADKTRLSKRHGATSVQAYRDMGYLPEALINYLARLGWSYKDQEVFTKGELIEKFTLESVGSSSAVFNPEKLLWLNSEYIKKSNPKALIPDVIGFLIKENIVKAGYSPDSDWLAKAIITLQERSRTLIELARSLKYYINDDIDIDEKAGAKYINVNTHQYLIAVKDGIDTMEVISEKAIEQLFFSLMERFGVKLGQIAQPVRVALTGNTVSPGIFEVIDIIGKEKTLRRLNKAINSVI
ncbi:MAG: glutamate--tRNA ligase [Candidatus Magnetoovum sp. WYHC-5]|nr:glutamate--tRNA ligase [Candidatus Magnetoovum sp. WYHC-5]